MTESCIIRCKNGCLKCIYTKDGCIYIRELHAVWSKALPVCSGIKNGFTVSISDRDGICVLYQQQDGSICFACERNEWQPTIILERHGSGNPDIMMHMIVKNKIMLLLYNIPHGNRQTITAQYRYTDGSWSSPLKIDDALPLDGRTFRIINDGDKNIMLYMRRDPELRLGCRIIDNEKIGEFKKIYATGYLISDYSLLKIKDTIHIAVIVSTGFSRQLVYICTADRPQPVTITEGRGIKNCMVSYIDDRLYIWWFYGSRLYYCVSYDNGASFGRQTKYSITVTDSVIRAQYIDEGIGNYSFCDLFVRESMPWDIKLLEDICPDFFCFNDKNVSEENEALKSNVTSLQKKLDIFAAELNEKDEKIYQLNRLLKMKNDELINMEITKNKSNTSKKAHMSEPAGKANMPVFSQKTNMFSENQTLLKKPEGES